MPKTSVTSEFTFFPLGFFVHIITKQEAQFRLDKAEDNKSFFQSEINGK